MTSNPPQSAGLSAKQAAAAAAARFAGYSSFYASPSPPAQAPNQTQFFRPPPRPMFNGPRGPPPPRPPHMVNGFARPPPPQFALNGRGPPPMVRPPPRPAPSQTPSPPSTSQWQWSNGNSVQATAKPPPVRFHISPQNRGPPPRNFNGPPGTFAAPTPAAPTAAAAMGGNAKWPDALHDYVKRAFARCKGAADQSITQNSLKEMITNAIMTNSLWTKNWTAEPLPVLVGDTPAAVMQTKIGMGGPMPGAAGNRLAPSPSNSSFQPNQGFVPFKEPSGKKNKMNKRKHDGLEMEDADLHRKNQRRQRFHMTQQELKSLVTPEVDTKKLQVLTQEGDLDLAAMVIKGTSQTVEKEYLRLTSPPHPSTVRPEPVLHKALELVKSKWKKGDHDYIYACSQLKSIRQDCTVQHIKNAFTVLVYETHARVALESGDINEFNQCQTQLHELYEKLIPGQAVEFLAYRILYCVYVSLQAKKGDSNAGQLGMYNVLGLVTPKLRADPAIAHALAVRQAVAMNDYHRFFKLYVDAPNMAGYLMDVMVPAIRLSALRAMCKAYRPTISVQYIRDELKLEGKAGKVFIRQSGLVFMKGDKTRVDTKSSNIVWVLSNESSLI
ncbi:Leukocyte receptor cluster member 8 [Phytophthora palmivora]|uniref:Leukocyte receptor cluster member 8 n=1 Tax=Phytophthora palmivora TaxID=4796 RepID=A0A2P4Y250_9STRA|nr:Leukocyte receptor cluster member 8 [Phytophthora palmivora]